MVKLGGFNGERHSYDIDMNTHGLPTFYTADPVPMTEHLEKNDSFSECG